MDFTLWFTIRVLRQAQSFIFKLSKEYTVGKIIRILSNAYIETIQFKPVFSRRTITQQSLFSILRKLGINSIRLDGRRKLRFRISLSDLSLASINR